MKLWVYRARCLNIVDGDTIDVEIDVGFRTYRKERLRLLGVNTPEKKTTTMVEGIAAQEFTKQWLDVGRIMYEWPLIIETQKYDAFGRYLAKVTRIHDNACLNDDLLKNGMAKEDIR